MFLAKVEKVKGESIRRVLFACNAVRKDLAIIEKGNYLLIPLKEDVNVSVLKDLDLNLIEGESFPRTYYKMPFERIVDIINIPNEIKSLLPRKWEKFGDVVILKFPSELDDYESEIARAYAKVLRAKTVCREAGIITGPYREPCVKVIYGNETETVHTENGVKYKFDVSRIMFSSGNINERKRMGELQCKGETIVDMFAGIGYFALPIAVHAKPRKIIACEINPTAYHYLIENVRLNRVESIINTYLGDNRDFPGDQIADRIIMGYIGTTRNFLPKAISLIKPGGIIHYHDVSPINHYPHEPLRVLDESFRGHRYELLGMRVVKSYGPSTIHFVADLRVAH